MLKRLTITGLVAASFTGAIAQEMPYPDTIIILDVSNSMWGQIDGVAKISIARDVVGDLVTDLQEDIDFGLMAYGHRAKADCGDIELVMPVGELDEAAFKNAVNSLTPRGRTPLTAAMREAANQLDYTSRSARIVLVSDGVESCDGNPSTLAKELADSGLDLTVHVIGFDVSGIEDLSGLQELAEQNHGLFLTPETAQELKDNLNTMMDMEVHMEGDDGMAHDMSATLSGPGTIAPRSRIEIGFTGPMGADADPVLAIARAGNSGNATLISPREAGNYELRYYSGEGDVLTSQPLTVQ